MAQVGRQVADLVTDRPRRGAGRAAGLRAAVLQLLERPTDELEAVGHAMLSRARLPSVLGDRPHRFDSPPEISRRGLALAHELLRALRCDDGYVRFCALGRIRGHRGDLCVAIADPIGRSSATANAIAPPEVHGQR